MELRMRKGTLDAKVDGTSVTSAQTASGFPALFGIAAATGGGTATFLIRNFSGAFYDCDP